MANKPDKKLAILLLRDYLYERTDADHAVTVPDMIDYLSSNEIYSERKTVYSDLRILRDDYGMDIVTDGYRHFVASRDFELEELKILVDMVQSSNFLTASKTDTLIKKIEGLASIYEGSSLGRRIFVRNRVKAKNESVYINIDRISDAIASDRMVCFQYFRYNLNKERELRHGGRMHQISPFALIWVDQNYYMLGYDSENAQMRHFRVDRMTNISVSPEPREGHRVFSRTDMSTYTNKVFYMFTGDETRVTLRCANYVIDSIIDRFGEDVIIIPDGEDHFTFTANIVVSPQFFAWISPFGKDIEIIHPSTVRRSFKSHLQNILELYDD